MLKWTKPGETLVKVHCGVNVRIGRHTCASCRSSQDIKGAHASAVQLQSISMDPKNLFGRRSKVGSMRWCNVRAQHLAKVVTRRFNHVLCARGRLVFVDRWVLLN
ncbi:hypothetical protein DIPPA_19190 [Diplonema papillatum]|nr:hypothetical protein DIPPA_19190 [Diplonema papillatum]